MNLGIEQFSAETGQTVHHDEGDHLIIDVMAPLGGGFRSGRICSCEREFQSAGSDLDLLFLIQGIQTAGLLSCESIRAMSRMRSTTGEINLRMLTLISIRKGQRWFEEDNRVSIKWESPTGFLCPA